MAFASRDVVNEGVEREELGASSDRTSDHRLNKSHLNVWEASFSKDLLGGIGSGNSSVVEEGVGLHTDGEDKRAEGLGLPIVGIREGVDGGPLYTNGIEAAVDALADREPSALNGVTVDRASLTDDAQGHRALVYRLVRTRLEDTGSAAAIKVAVGVGVLVGEAGRLGVPLAIVRERKLGQR